MRSCSLQHTTEQGDGPIIRVIVSFPRFINWYHTSRTKLGCNECLLKAKIKAVCKWTQYVGDDKFEEFG